ncbi:hypothetical protein, partial [Actinomadura sp. CNU-125]|uniref:hypothetical protein n=1 Tax=Actinomadura sp. CNU-125 TaxID=1904961 RepID=UPI0021CC9E3C
RKWILVGFPGGRRRGAAFVLTPGGSCSRVGLGRRDVRVLRGELPDLPRLLRLPVRLRLPAGSSGGSCAGSYPW